MEEDQEDKKTSGWSLRQSYPTTLDTFDYATSHFINQVVTYILLERFFAELGERIKQKKRSWKPVPILDLYCCRNNL